MTKVFLTGGNGFVAAHVLKVLLDKGHSVVTTVRSDEKAKKIFALYPNVPKSRLDVVIVEDLAKPNSFNKAIISEPPFDVVIHTASPFRFNVQDIKTELLDPAMVGTTGILESIKKYAPSVKRVIITSSVVAVTDPTKGNRPGYVYSESDWNPISEEVALSNPVLGYLGSKAFAERAAWNFMEIEKPNFTLTCLNPAIILGPIINGDLRSINTAHVTIVELLTGKYKGKDIPNNPIFQWVDVRDLAKAHEQAIDAPGAVGSRIIFSNGVYSFRQIVEIIRKNFPEYYELLPSENAIGGDFPEEGLYDFSNSKRTEVFGKEMTGLEQCVVDMVKSFKELGI
ncbi:NADPH-dependent methylglyoxal reductase-like protein GRE2 [Xylogone sp. PMI_703]|nr:NADPH-dependent methylglyoxal reductase-like protein GRE2 [Xylogone sp. PMI_703]